MYVHDYYYAYPAGIPGSYSNAWKSWLFRSKDGYNSSPSYEWLSTRWGVYSASDYRVAAQFINHNGAWSFDPFYNEFGVRPVFYLSSKAKIKEGDGTKASPYTLD